MHVDSAEEEADDEVDDVEMAGASSNEFNLAITWAVGCSLLDEDEEEEEEEEEDDEEDDEDEEEQDPMVSRLGCLDVNCWW